MRRRMTLARFLSVLVVLTLTISVAHAQNAPATILARTPAAQGSPIDQGSHTELSEEECRGYAQAVVKAITTGDRTALNALIDWESFTKSATAGFGLPDAEVEGMKRGMRKSLEGKGSLVDQLIQNSETGGSFHLLRLREDRKRWTVLFRMIQPATSGRFTYYEFVPRRFAGGNIRTIDIYPFFSGEFMSTAVRKMLLPVAADRSRTLLDRLLGGERDYVLDFPKIGVIAHKMKEGKGQEALVLIKDLRSETKKQKAVLLLRLRAAQDSGAEKDLSEAVEDLRRLFPGDPCLDLLSIEYYTAKKEYGRALECVDRLDKAVGGDSYLNVVRAGIADARGDRLQAKRLAYQAITDDPTLKSGYFVLLGFSVEDQTYDETLAYLKKLDQRFGVRFKDLTTVPEYAGFAKSPEFKQWLSYLEQKHTLQKKDEGRSPSAEKSKRPTPAQTGSAP
jgi:hypothetical protein